MFVSSLESRMTPETVTAFVDKLAGTTDDTNPNEVPDAAAKWIVKFLNKFAVALCNAKNPSDKQCDLAVWKNTSTSMIDSVVVDGMKEIVNKAQYLVIAPAIVLILILLYG
eukprot:244223_1